MLSLVVGACAFSSPLSESSLAGNVMFDPLNLARTREQLFRYRVAELKHGRLAMLAAVAYPAQEVANPPLSQALHLPNQLAFSKLSPSLVNGGLEPATIVWLVGLGSGLELYRMTNKDLKRSTLAADYHWRWTDAPPGSEACHAR